MEMSLGVDLLKVLIPCCYALAAGFYAFAFFRESPVLERLKTPFLIVTVLLHFLYLALRTAQFDHPPITSVFEIMTLLAWSIALAYLYIEVRTRTRSTGFIILTLPLVFQIISSLFIRNILEIPVYLHSLVLGFHVSAALIGYTAISLSAAYGLLYLLLYHEIKSSRLGVIYARLPSLEKLETMSHKAEAFGFVMLSVAIVIGIVWLPRVFLEFSYWDPKLVGTLVIWALYAAGLSAKRLLGWQGKKTMVIAVLGFGFVLLGMTVINLYLSRFHSFH
jgi:ABC-type transport system involved in cytochrome c biogenesis permease subunit